MLKKLKILYLFLILGLALYLRLSNINKFHNIDADEKSWILNGHFLLEEGAPKSWTIFWNEYVDNQVETVANEQFVVVKPYLDHPPLFSILIGLWIKVMGISNDVFTNWSIVRLPMVIISITTIGVTSLLAKEILGKEVGVLTLFTYSFFPGSIVVSKLIAAEHLLSLVFVSSLLIVVKLLNDKKKKKNYYLESLAFLSFVSILIKLNGVVIPATIITILFLNKKNKEAYVIVSSFLLAIFSYVAYGIYFGRDLFWKIMAAHGQRPQTSWFFFTIFDQFDLGYRQINDPTSIFGAVGAFLLAMKNKIFSIALLFVSFILLFVAPLELYAWYKFLFIPFISIGFAWFLYQLKKPKFEVFILLIPMVLVLFENVMSSYELQFNSKPIVIALFLLVLFFMKFHKKISPKVYSLFLLVILLVIFSLQSIWAIALTGTIL